MEVCVPKRILAGVLICAAAGSLQAQNAQLELPDLVRQAFATVESDVQSHWRFSEVSHDGDVERIANYDPSRSRSEQWLLVSVDARSPSAQEQADFRQQKREQRERESKRNGDAAAGPLDSINVDSVRLLAEDRNGWRIGFEPRGVGGSKKMMSKMRGTLHISKPERCVEFLEIASPEPFKPQIGVKVEHFLSRFEFAQITQAGQAAGRCGRLLPVTMQFEMTVRAFGVMAVDRAMRATYSDYTPVAAD